MTSFDELCRLCLDNPGVIGIFEIQDFHHDIFACTGVKIHPSDNLPQNICSTCSEIVENAAKLRQLALKSDETLKMFTRDDCDDDSRDTLCISLEEQSSEKCLCNSQSSEGINAHCTNETCKNKQDDSLKTNKFNIRTNLFETASSTDDSLKTNKFKIRTDLFETASSNNILVVRSKKDYDMTKMKIKENPDYKIVFKCEICEKKSITWKKLYQHLRNHDKKYCCPLDVCGKKFATRGDLEKHLRTHTGVRPYTCDICDKSFTQQGALKAHKEKVHMCYTVP